MNQAATHLIPPNLRAVLVESERGEIEQASVDSIPLALGKAYNYHRAVARHCYPAEFFVAIRAILGIHERGWHLRLRIGSLLPVPTEE